MLQKKHKVLRGVSVAGAPGPDMIAANKNEQTEGGQPPIGLAGLASFGSLAAVYFAARPFIAFLDRWEIQWLLYISIPLVVPFIILYRSSWHRELPGVTRTLSIFLSSCIIYGVVLLASALAVAVISVFFSEDMISS